MTSPRKRTRTSTSAVGAAKYSALLEQSSRGLLQLNVGVLECMEKKVGLGALRALQSLERIGPSLVTELGADLDLLPSSASRLSDRLADAGLITRSISPTNRRATVLALTEAGRGVLDELVSLRIEALRSVIDRMSDQDRAVLIQGTDAFTAAQQELAEQGGKQRGRPA
jgi:DNA-binding MarR family transcriptional regulator